MTKGDSSNVSSNSEIEWYGFAQICAKQLKHYPAFRRSGTIISVHSFVLILAIVAEERSNYIGYLEDMYEDKRGKKKIKVRWFHHYAEVMNIPQLNPKPREVFYTPLTQVISAECVDGPATVVTPEHFAKCLEVLSFIIPSVRICHRQLNDNIVKSFDISTLTGYYNQAILTFLYNSLETGCRAISQSHIRGSEPKIPMTGDWMPSYVIGILVAGTQPKQLLSFHIYDKIELLCQDSGICGCWFICTPLRSTGIKLKVRYNDLQDIAGRGNLKEWVPAPKRAAPDKLGMRIENRLTMRLSPPVDSSPCTFEVGSAVDAWWSDGWWEGVVTKVNLPGKYNLQIYLPDENMLLTAKRKNVRTSRDWVNNRWVDIKPKPDILSYLSEHITPSVEEALRRFGVYRIASVTTSKQDTVAAYDQESGNSAESEFLQNVKRVNPRKRLRPSNEHEADKSSDDGCDNVSDSTNHRTPTP